MFHNTMGVDHRIALIAGRQLGVFSRRQAEGAGASRAVIEHQLKSGRWIIARRGVFRLNGSPRSFEQDVLAACLSMGEGAVASHGTAARIWGMVEFAGPSIEVSVPVSRRCSRDGLLIHHVKLSPKDVTLRGVIPITSPFRTLLDLAGTVDKPVIFERAFDYSLRQGLITPPKLLVQIAQLEGSTVAGLHLMRKTIESRIGLGIPGSDLETLFVALLARYGLPQPIRQQRITDDGSFISRVDFRYPDHNVVVECDGESYHSIGPDWERDLERGTDLALAGQVVLRFSWKQVLYKGRTVCAKVAQALGIPFKS